MENKKNIAEGKPVALEEENSACCEQENTAVADTYAMVRNFFSSLTRSEQRAFGTNWGLPQYFLEC